MHSNSEVDVQVQGRVRLRSGVRPRSKTYDVGPAAAPSVAHKGPLPTLESQESDIEKTYSDLSGASHVENASNRQFAHSVLRIVERIGNNIRPQRRSSSRPHYAESQLDSTSANQHKHKQQQQQQQRRSPTVKEESPTTSTTTTGEPLDFNPSTHPTVQVTCSDSTQKALAAPRNGDNRLTPQTTQSSQTSSSSTHSNTTRFGFRQSKTQDPSCIWMGAESIGFVRDILTVEMHNEESGLNEIFLANFSEENYWCWKDLYQSLSKHAPQSLSVSPAVLSSSEFAASFEFVSPQGLLSNAVVIYRTYLSSHSPYTVSVSMDTHILWDEIFLHVTMGKSHEWNALLHEPNFLTELLVLMHRSLIDLEFALSYYVRLFTAIPGTAPSNTNSKASSKRPKSSSSNRVSRNSMSIFDAPQPQTSLLTAMRAKSHSGT